jgi:uncharacterized protein
MDLRRPQQHLAGCCWLPRIVDKVRLSEQGRLPLLYRLSLGSPIGIDGYFLRHFGLSFRQFRNAIREIQDDEGVARWFLSQPGVNVSSIADWNDYGVKLGTPGYPGSLVRHVMKWFVYPKALKEPVTNLFEMIEQDEKPETQDSSRV